MKPRLPDFIGIGAPKAGTTWLAGVIARHPDVFMPAIKETHFFDYPYDQYPFSKYEEFFSAAAPGQIVGEFSTDYLASAAAPARIHRHLPGVKLIAVLRDPVGQVYSNYWHALRQGFNCSDRSMPDFETALVRHRGQLLEPGFYGRHLERWLAVFPRRQMLILFYDDIERDPAAVIRSVEDFLGLRPVAAAGAGEARGGGERQGVAPRSGWLGRIYTRLYFAANRWVLQPISRRMGYETAGRLIQRLRLRRIGEHLFFQRGYPPLPPELRARLVAIYRDDRAVLEGITGRDLSSWT